ANTTLANSSVINIDLMCTVTFLHDAKGEEHRRRQRHKKNPTNPFVPFVALYCFTGMSKWTVFTTPLRWNCTQIAIKEAVLSRRMPPWGAVKGFGDFRNDQGLSQAELELITDWVDSDTPKGNNPNALPKEPKFERPSAVKTPKNAITVSGDLTL